MEETHVQIIETLVVIVAYFLLRLAVNRSIDRTIANHLMNRARAKTIKKVIHLLALGICLIALLVIWGIDQSELAVFVGSALAVIGIALFAQWSILSNITSGIIIFFSHSVKLDDTITIIDKDYEIEGRVSDIGLFFVILKTKDGEQISLPSNVFIQKMIKKKMD